MPHYKLTNETILYCNKTILYRIQATEDGFWGVVGTKGGFVQGYHNLKDRAWIGNEAIVWKNACVSETAHVYENSILSDNVKVFGAAEVFGYSKIFDNVQIHGTSKVFGYSSIYGNVKIYEKPEIFCCVIGGDVIVSGFSNIKSVNLIGDFYLESVKLEGGYINKTQFRIKEEPYSPCSSLKYPTRFHQYLKNTNQINGYLLFEDYSELNGYDEIEYCNQYDNTWKKIKNKIHTTGKIFNRSNNGYTVGDRFYRVKIKQDEIQTIIGGAGKWKIKLKK